METSCREGKIYEHLVDNVVLRDPPMGISPLWTNLQRVFNPQPVPCPGGSFNACNGRAACHVGFMTSVIVQAPPPHMHYVAELYTFRVPGLRCQGGNAFSPARQLPEALVGRLALAIVSGATAGLLLQPKGPTYGARHMEPGSGMN